MGKENSSSTLKKGPWTKEEDQKLLDYIREHGGGNWRSLPAKAGLQRCGKSCRLRWTNYLRPDITRGKFSVQEEKTILRLHALLGNRWSMIAAYLPRRTDNEIKNYWNTRLKKRLARLAIDPVTHRQKEMVAGATIHSGHVGMVSHMAQWEMARLEAEARLVRESEISSKLQLRRKSITKANPSSELIERSMPRCLDVLQVWKATASSNGIFGSMPTSIESPTSTFSFDVNTVGNERVPVGMNDGVSGNNNAAEMVHCNVLTSHSVENCFGFESSGEFDFIDRDYLAEFEENGDYWAGLLSSTMNS